MSDSLERDVVSAAHGAWTLGKLLSVPFRIEAATVEASAGHWIRCASYPELPDCTAEAATIEDALRLLERRRVEVIVAMMRDGACPATPRPPLRDCDPQGVADALGLGNLVRGLLDHTSLDGL